MRALLFANAMFGVASAVVLAGACSDFNGVDPPEAGASADGATGEDGTVTGGGDDASSSSSGGNKTDSGGDASMWTPKDLAGLTVWLDATVGVVYDTSNVVTGWKDQSGQLNNAILIGPCVDVQGNTIACVGPLRSPGSLNGRDTLQYSDGDAFSGLPRRYLSISDNASVQFGTGDFAIFEVVRYSAPSCLWSKFSVPTGNPQADFSGVLLRAYDTLGLADRRMASGSDINAVAGITTGLQNNLFVDSAVHVGAMLCRSG